MVRLHKKGKQIDFDVHDRWRISKVGNEYQRKVKSVHDTMTSIKERWRVFTIRWWVSKLVDELCNKICFLNILICWIYQWLFIDYVLCNPHLLLSILHIYYIQIKLWTLPRRSRRVSTFYCLFMIDYSSPANLKQKRL